MHRKKPRPRGLKFHDIPDQMMAQRLEAAVLRYSDSKRKKAVISREMSGWKSVIVKTLESIGSAHVDLGSGRFVRVEMRTPKNVASGKLARPYMKFEVKS